MTRRYFPLFDALRGVAAMMVLIFHVTLLTPRLGFGPFGRVAEMFGSLGVELFFVISGFLLYRPFAARRAENRAAPKPKDYFRRRALRIIPAYWVILTVLVIYPGVRMDGGFWRYYGFLQLYDRDTIGKGLPVAWSLCVEVTFYLALPVWSWALRRTALRAELALLALVGLAGAAVQVLAADHDRLYILSRSLVGQAPFFAAGMALALLHVAGRQARLVERRSALCWLGAAVALGLLAWQVPPGGIFGSINQNELLGADGVALRIVLSVAFVALVALPAVFGDERGEGLPRRFLAWGPVAWIGLVSYSVFLWHLPIAELLALPGVPEQFDAGGLDLVHRVDHLTLPLLFYMTITFTLALSWITFRFVERPAMRARVPRDAKEW